MGDVVLNTPHESIEVGCRIEAKDFKSGFVCLLCLERSLYKGKLSENHAEFETKEDLKKHIEKEHLDLALYI